MTPLGGGVLAPPPVPVGLYPSTEADRPLQREKRPCPEPETVAGLRRQEREPFVATWPRWIGGTPQKAVQLRPLQRTPERKHRHTRTKEHTM